MNQTFEMYQSYQTNKPIVFTEKIIEATRIKIAAECTLYANLNKKSLIAKATFDEQIKAVKALAKEQNTTLKGINKLKQFVEDNYTEYLNQIGKYYDDFDKFVILWQEHVDYMKEGYTDDVIYKSILLPLKFKIENYSNLQTVISKIERIDSDLEKAITNLNTHNMKSITIF